jgi:DNA topoisomerase-1
VGLITYMRTDSTRVSDDAIRDVRQYIGERYGREFVPESANAYRSKKDAQDAHEAIRPTSMAYAPEDVEKFLAEDEMKLYRLIWNRFVASQMLPALYDQTTIDVAGKGKNGLEYLFRATGSVLKFEGFLKVYQEGKDQLDEEDEEMKHRLPQVAEGERLRFRGIRPEQHFTEPPPRYNEATLVKRLEADGVGRPSTYASILSTIQEREYVRKEGGRFFPTELGMVVTDLLLESFDDIFEVKYTARMEEELDEIEEGKLDWRAAMSEFYERFDRDLKHAEEHMTDIKRMEKPTDLTCEKCGKPLVIKWGKHGSFIACTGYPDCTYTRELTVDLPDVDKVDLSEQGDEEYCENCGRPMVLKKGRFGTFYACTGYPDCKTTKPIGGQQKKPDRPLDEPCPQCGSNLVVKTGRYGEFTACSNYPTCKYVKQKTIGVKCPECSEGEVVERRSKRGKTFYGCNRWPDCNFVAWGKPIAEKCPECGSPYMIEKWLKGGPVWQCPNADCKHKQPVPVPTPA